MFSISALENAANPSQHTHS